MAKRKGRQRATAAIEEAVAPLVPPGAGDHAMLRKIFTLFVLPKLIAYLGRRGSRPRPGRTY